MVTLEEEKRTGARRRGRPAGSNSDIRRQRILDVAEELFTESGEPPAMDAVAAAAGVTRTAIYHYFPTKQDLVRAVLMRGMDWNWWAAPVEESHELPTFSARLQNLLHVCITRSRGETNGDFYWALVAASNADEEIREAVRSYGDEMRKSIFRLIEQSISDGLLSQDTDVQALSKAVLGLIWCVAAGVRNTRSERVRDEIELAATLAAGGTSAFVSSSNGKGPRRISRPRTGRSQEKQDRSPKGGPEKRRSKSAR